MGERKRIKFRTCLGKLGKRRSDLIVGGKAPYGYRYIPRTRERPGYYKIVEEEAEWVRKIFPWFAFEDLSIEKIARTLAEMGVPRQSLCNWGKKHSNPLLH